MNPRIRNPHPVDLSNYFHGEVVVLGGRDLERDEVVRTSSQKENEKNKSHELDWSFLKRKPSKRS